MTKFRKLSKFIKAQRELGFSKFIMLTTSDEIIIKGTKRIDDVSEIFRIKYK